MPKIKLDSRGWGYTKEKGLCVVKPKKEKEWNTRLRVLKNHIKLAMLAQSNSKEIDVQHLFYDGWSL